LAKARRNERTAFEQFAKLRAQTRAMLQASGPAGAEALDRLDAEQGKSGGGEGGSES
jgi:hypothetical protein